MTAAAGAAQALQCYKWVMEAMGDRSRSREWGVMELKLVKTLAQAPPQLCDEVYCQLCKQLTNNPNPCVAPRNALHCALLTRGRVLQLIGAAGLAPDGPAHFLLSLQLGGGRRTFLCSTLALTLAPPLARAAVAVLGQLHRRAAH